MGEVLFAATFPPERPKLVTNEFAHWNPNHPDALQSPDWQMTSGSLYSYQGCGYTGSVDGGSPGPRSEERTGSAVWRLNTRRADYGDVQVACQVKIGAVWSTPRTPPVDWDGVHLWLRYQSQYHLYVASVARRDGAVVIKKKVPGGPSNHGTYHQLTPTIAGYPIRVGQWRDVSATATTADDGAVHLTVSVAGHVAATAVDDGQGGPPITAPGAVGIRGDNTRFQFRGFEVTAAGRVPPDPPPER